MGKVIPATVDEALAAWDAGDEVQTIEMGGLGAGYEMAIQCVAFEMMRELRDNSRLRLLNAETDDGARFPPEFGEILDAVVARLDAFDETTQTYALGGLSGAQVGAAKSMAVNLTRHGYDNARKQCADRLIFVRKQDPMSLYEPRGVFARASQPA